MYIKISSSDGDKEYLVSQDVKEQLLSIILSEGMKIFDKLSTAHQIVAEQAARGILYSMEKKMLSAGAKKDVAAQLRPDKKQSPMKKLIDVVGILGRDFDIDGGIDLSIDEDNTAYNIEFWRNE